MRRIAAFLILLISPAPSGIAQVSTNVRLDHWSYLAVDKLASYRLIDSAMLGMKPISRLEMARHVARAIDGLGRMDEPPETLVSIVERLKREFKGDLMQIGVLDGPYSDSFVKPVEDPYLRYLYADARPELENMRGDTFESHSNYRVGFASRARFSNLVVFYVHPEYQGASSEMDGNVELIEAYGKVALGPVEVQAGKDSLWWGPGYHGSVLMSNNAQPFTMVKITTPQPIQLPWVLRGLGPFRAEWFLAELEEDRAIPKAGLSGIRVNFKPHVNWEMGISRVAMFGGHGVPSVDFFDYVEMMLARTEQEDNNQLAGFDTSILLPLAKIPYGELLPLRSVKFYVDAAGEDESGGLPSNWAFLYGLQLNDVLKTGRTDLRLEYFDNHVAAKPNVFYNHSLYTSGYRYKGRVIGHHVDTDSRDVFVQLSHYLSDDLILDLMYDHQTHDLSAGTHPTVNIFECGLTLFQGEDWQVRSGHRYEDASGAGYRDNQVFQLQLIREF